MILLSGNTLVLEEIAKDTLEIDHNYRMLKLVRTTAEVVTERPLEESFGLRVQLGLDVLFLLDLRLLVWHWLLSHALVVLLLGWQFVVTALSQLGHTILVCLALARLALNAHF